jgi:deoxyribose-phosphate aldolase
VTPHGHVAALCIWPPFVRTAKAALAGTAVKVATVANFPAGGEDTAPVLREVEQSLADGADEIDLVMPYRAFLDGRPQIVEGQIRAVRERLPADRLLKVILETGLLQTPERIRDASLLAIEAGAGMLKTSTGKVAVNATPAAAGVMLAAIRDSGAPVGFKAAGGIRTPEAAAAYFDLADRIMGPSWARPATFRLGASGLLDELLAVLQG